MIIEPENMNACLPRSSNSSHGADYELHRNNIMVKEGMTTNINE